eukprot:CAMPEP_0172384346 /NCGR_PEP_ID=MMETSP1061-20121228/2129_1 /TAXON_ID=37318 /ORGANISM="Pseudo-nitzschia pungens, Strain cf. pungens" /LENGTH=371 /DNA_ID=CAMNT_0013112943 /DNA_START=616 /DNA_END=1731 /DNA_ORIENTATION=-
MTGGALRRNHIINFVVASVLLLSFYETFIGSRREWKHTSTSTHTGKLTHHQEDGTNGVPSLYDTDTDTDTDTGTGTRHPGDCMGLEVRGSLDTLLHNVDQVYISMPAKAAGSSMKAFAISCMNVDIQIKVNLFNKVPRINGKRPIGEYLTESFEPPSLIASHLYSDIEFTHLVKHSTTRSLIIYLHRDEPSRVLSAIKQVTTMRLCPEKEKEKQKQKQSEPCTVREQDLVAAIQKKVAEIGFGATEILTCDSYDALDDNAPNFVFVHYTQASRLQKLLAKRFCPAELNQPAEVSVRNVSTNKRKIHVELQRDNSIVSLQEWLEAKKGLLEYALELRESASCQAKTRAMEEKLFHCPDETLHFGKVWEPHHD